MLQCWTLQCQIWEAENWSEIPLPKSGNQPSHVLHWERQKSGLHTRIESIEDAAWRTFQWNAAVESQFTLWGQGCSKSISLHLGSTTWNSLLKTDNPLLLYQTFKVRVCARACYVCVRVCVCAREFWDERNKRRWVTQLLISLLTNSIVGRTYFPGGVTGSIPCLVERGLSLSLPSPFHLKTNHSRRLRWKL